MRIGMVCTFLYDLNRIGSIVSLCYVLNKHTQMQPTNGLSHNVVPRQVNASIGYDLFYSHLILTPMHDVPLTHAKQSSSGIQEVQVQERDENHPQLGASKRCKGPSQGGF